MHEPRKEFAEHLIACEKPHPGFRERYEKELCAMLENKLSVRQKRESVGVAVVLAIAAAITGYVGSGVARARTPANELPAFMGTWLLLTAVALFGIVAVLGIGAYRGGYQRVMHGKVVTGIAVVYVGMTGWIFMLAARFAPELFRYDMLVFGGVLLLYAATAWIRHRIAQSELKTREQFLEIELRLAEIFENLSVKTLS